MHQVSGLPLQMAYSTYAVFVSLIWTLPLAGGYLAGKAGYRAATFTGLLLAIVGMALLALKSLFWLRLGLAIFVVGNGLCTPAIFCLVDHAYKKQDPRRESGFTLFYLLFNLGAVLGVFITTFLAKHYGYGFAFSSCVVIILVSLLCFLGLVSRQPFDISRSLAPQWRLSTTGIVLLLLFIAALSSMLIRFLFIYMQWDNWLLYLFAVIAVGYGIYIGRKQKEKLARYRVYGFLTLCIISIVFFTLYNLGPSLLSVFASTNVHRELLGIHFPAESLFAFEGVGVILLGIVLSRLWWVLAKRQRNPSLPYKFAFSLISVGLAYLYLTVLVPSYGSHLIPLIVMLFSYILLALGELLLMPLGIAMVGDLSPKGYEGFFMGMWQLMQGLAAILAGLVASYTVVPKASSLLIKNQAYFYVFLCVGGASLLAGILVLCFSKRIKRLL